MFAAAIMLLLATLALLLVRAVKGPSVFDRLLAGKPRIVGALEGLIRRPGAAARPALPPADAGGP